MTPLQIVIGLIVVLVLVMLGLKWRNIFLNEPASTTPTATSEVAASPVAIASSDSTVIASTETEDTAPPEVLVESPPVTAAPEPVAASPVVASPVAMAPPTEGYGVHVASFLEPARAIRQIEILAGMGFRAFSLPRTINEKQWERVYVGPFADRDSVRAASRSLRLQGFNTYARIVNFGS